MLRFIIQLTFKVFMLVKKNYQIHQMLLYLIQLSIKHYLKKHICMLYHMNIMINIKFVNMELMVHLIDLYQKELQKL